MEKIGSVRIKYFMLEDFIDIILANGYLVTIEKVILNNNDYAIVEIYRNEEEFEDEEN